MEQAEPGPVGEYPWFRTHAHAAVLMSVGLFVAVTAMHVVVNGTGEAVDILYALPVALLAMSFGLWGGLVGAAVGFSLFAVVELVDGVGDIDAIGWCSRAAGLLLLGALLGRASDQIDAAQARTTAMLHERQVLDEQARRQHEGLEISDSILQHLAVAKWMVEVGRPDEAIAILTSTMAAGERMVADLLPERRGAVDTRQIVDEIATPLNPASAPPARAG